MTISQHMVQQTHAVRAALKEVSGSAELSPETKAIIAAVEDLQLWADSLHKECTSLASSYATLKSQVDTVERRMGGIERKIR